MRRDVVVLLCCAALAGCGGQGLTVEQAEAMPPNELARLYNCQLRESIGPTADGLDAGAIADPQTVVDLWEEGYHCKANPPKIPDA